ncbi:iron chelate uptake ABC transporter family permease subunit [Pseudoroseicyclus sp. CXY001]|uniref:iron chelate uptake ABC transporter family permease subunit n=1 Tax=Pseudoroseicyclus sp. CXY001 TaxID=3242492 RepID=UPI0035713E15
MPERRLLLLALGLVLLCAVYLGWGLRAPYGFILSLRVTKLAALVVTGLAVGAATILFQTVAANRLLTPGIVGFDSLFVFIQTTLVLTLGAAGFASLPGLAQFAAETACLMIAGLVIFGTLFLRGSGDLLRMILTGVILGVFLRGLSSFAGRLLEPSEFAIVQQASVASFGAVDRTELAVAACVLVLALAAALRLAPALDAAALGRMTARGIGLDHDRVAMAALALVTLCVALTTALVGPVAFLGLLAASLAHAALGTWRHRLLIPASGLIGAMILVAGQTVFERVLGLQSALAIVVEFAGGLLFLTLVLRRPAR